MVSNSKDDPSIEKIREIKHQISEENAHDPKKLVNYYIELQKKYGASRSVVK